MPVRKEPDAYRRVESEHAHRHIAAGFMLFATAILAYELEQTNGHYNANAIVWVVAAWGACLAALLLPFQTLLGFVVPASRFPSLSRHAKRTVVFGTLGWALYQLLLLLAAQQDSDGHRLSEELQAHSVQIFWAASVALTALALVRQWIVKETLFVALVLAHAAVGLWVLNMATNPQIDVWTVEMDSAKALMHGSNPFAITFPDPYHGMSSFFPPGVSVNGRLQFGFVYPPLCLLLCVPGLLFGDTRFATLAAMGIAALLIARVRPQREFGIQAMLAAALFLFTPRTFFVVHRAWTDPFVVMLTALVAYCALRRPRWLCLAAGLYCCVKQHMFIAAPALVLLLPRPWSVRQVVTFYAKATGFALLVTLPLAIWNVPAFVNSVLNIREVFRTDSLSLLAHLANTGVVHLSKWTGIGVAAAVCVLGVWRAPRNASGFALVAACTHFSLYLFSTHAFCNEYYNVIGSLCVALACYDERRHVDSSETADLGK